MVTNKKPNFYDLNKFEDLFCSLSETFLSFHKSVSNPDMNIANKLEGKSKYDLGKLNILLFI